MSVVRSWLCRPAVAALVLLAIYVGLSFANDSRAFLSTDTGAKVATLEVMKSESTVDLDVGYWAAAYDSTGHLHPLFDTQHIGNKWISVTTVPMLVIGDGLFRLGGYHLALLLPMLGAIAAAFAGRALASRLGASEGRSWIAFWVIGLASPALIYALDFWEHTVGLALIAWAAVLMLDVAERRAGLRAAAVAGVLLGTAFTMRTEALVYATVITGAVCVWRVIDRRIVEAVRIGVAAVIGFAVVTAAELALEYALYGEAFRFARASKKAVSSVSGGSGVTIVPGSRISDALVSTFGLNGGTEVGRYLIAVGLAALLAYVGWRARPGTERIIIIGPLAVIVVVFVLRMSEGLGFVPGLFAAAPLAALALGVGWRDAGSRWVCAVAAVSIPLVWATQYVGGAAPQWGGRYQLVSGLLLTVVAVVALPALDRRVGGALIALSVLVTAFGFAWMVQRTHTFADTAAAVSRRPEPVIVSTIGHFEREGATFYQRKLALTAISDAEVRDAADVVHRAGYSSFGLLRVADSTKQPLPISGWTVTGRSTIAFFPGNPLEVDTYAFAG